MRPLTYDWPNWPIEEISIVGGMTDAATGGRTDAWARRAERYTAIGQPQARHFPRRTQHRGAKKGQILAATDRLGTSRHIFRAMLSLPQTVDVHPAQH
jgi:thiamine monophosphate kinase